VQFLKFSLGHQVSGAMVEVVLRGVASNVFLVDDLNLHKLERGGQFTYYGGHCKKVTCPAAGPIEWDVDRRRDPVRRLR
jgi:Domain of unknown function (DUF1883)